MWCIPPKQNADFVAHMEDILEVYALSYDPEIPLICMDEKPYQLLAEELESLPMKHRQPVKEDYKYVRCGVSNIFVFTEPLGGWRHVSVTARRTKVDWALSVRELLEVYYPKAKRIRMVMDNLNTHGISSLYEAFPADVALNLAKRLEIHYTPKHGSWLNVAEIELSVMSSQCLKRRLSSTEELVTQLSAWETIRNNSNKTVNWQFTTDDARIKLKSLYPRI
jgi:hypothetical protein